MASQVESPIQHFIRRIEERVDAWFDTHEIETTPNTPFSHRMIITTNLYQLQTIIRAFVPGVAELSWEGQPFFAGFFGSSIPKNLTDDEYAQLEHTFDEALNRLSLGNEEWLDILSRAFSAELQFEDNDTDEDDDERTMIAFFPDWYGFAPITRRGPLSQVDPPVDVVGLTQMWLEDLHGLNATLRWIFWQIRAMVHTDPHQEAFGNRPFMQNLLDAASRLRQVHLPPADLQITMEMIVGLETEFALAENYLRDVLGYIIAAEQYLIDREHFWLITGSNPTFYHISRYERSRYRSGFADMCAGMGLERFRSMTFPKSPQPQILTRSGREAEECPICADELEAEQGEITTPNIVTYTCCNQPFHVDCYLNWLLQKLTEGEQMTCPICRTLVPLDMLAEALALKVHELNVL